jgi:hypothetical protein
VDQRFCHPYCLTRCTRGFSRYSLKETLFCEPPPTLVCFGTLASLHTQQDVAVQHPPSVLLFPALLVMDYSAPAPTPEIAVCSVLSSSRRSGSCWLGIVVLSLVLREIVAASAEMACSATRYVSNVGRCVLTDATYWTSKATQQ